jgi:K+-transporting ATPase c subunit
VRTLRSNQSATDPARTEPAPYNTASYAGSDLGPTNRNLLDRLRTCTAASGPLADPNIKARMAAATRR